MTIPAGNHCSGSPLAARPTSVVVASTVSLRHPADKNLRHPTRLPNGPFEDIHPDPPIQTQPRSIESPTRLLSSRPTHPNPTSATLNRVSTRLSATLPELTFCRTTPPPTQFTQPDTSGPTPATSSTLPPGLVESFIVSTVLRSCLLCHRSDWLTCHVC